MVRRAAYLVRGVALVLGCWQASDLAVAQEAAGHSPDDGWGQVVPVAVPWMAADPIAEADSGRRTADAAEPLVSPGAPQRSGTQQQTPPQAAPRPAQRDELAFLTARAPNIFGHFFNIGGSIKVSSSSEYVTPNDIPLAGACGRLSVAENNNALPQDRVYFLYNHFQNAMVAGSSFANPGGTDLPVDRYVVGFEKTYCCGLWSVEMRMPFAGQVEYLDPNASVDGGQIGNAAFIAKRVLRRTDVGVIAAGLGVDSPTGSKARGESSGFEYLVHNEAVHLHPFLALSVDPPSGLFCQAFVQVDVPLNGNWIDGQWAGSPVGLGNWTEQPLFHVDLALGRWLIRNCQGAFLTGLASIVEFHYISTLSDANLLEYRPNPYTAFSFGNAANRVDLADLTVGLHAEFNQSLVCRVGGVFPLKTGDDRAFDAEVQVQVERRF